MRAPVHVDDAPGVRPGDVEDVDLLLVGHVDDFKSRRVEESGSARRLAAQEGRKQIFLRVPDRRERTRPRRERNVSPARNPAETGTNFPVTFLVGRRPEVDMTVRPARRGLGRLRVRDRRENHENHENPWNTWNPGNPWNLWILCHRITSFCPVDSTIIVVGIEPAALLPSLASAAPSTVTLSPIFSVSFFQPPRTSAYGGPISTRKLFTAPTCSETSS